MKTNLTAVEYAQLEPKARAKYRKLMKEYEAILNPVRSAKIQLENQLRKQAYTELNIAERVEEAQAPLRSQLAEISEQLKELNAKWREVADKIQNVATNIETEPYHVAYNDPQVQALSSIWSNINETQAKKLEEFLTPQEVNA